MVRWRALRPFVTVTALILFILSVFGGGASAEPFPSASSSAGVYSTEEPSFSVDADKQEGSPGDRVTLSFAPNDNGWVVVGCNAAFSGVRQNCTPSGLDPSVELTVPADAPPGPTSIPWTLFYTTVENAGGTHDALPRKDGTTPFVVLPPSTVDSPEPSGGVGGGGGRDGGGDGSVSQPPISVPPAFPPALPPGTTPTAGSGSLPIGIPMLFVVLAAAVLAAALISRRIRAGAAVAAAPAGQTVRVVPHPEPGAQVTVSEAPPGLTHVVRLEPRTGIATVNVQEGPK